MPTAKPPSSHMGLLRLLRPVDSPQPSFPCFLIGDAATERLRVANDANQKNRFVAQLPVKFPREHASPALQLKDIKGAQSGLRITSNAPGMTSDSVPAGCRHMSRFRIASSQTTSASTPTSVTQVSTCMIHSSPAWRERLLCQKACHAQVGCSLYVNSPFAFFHLSSCFVAGLAAELAGS